MGPVFKVERKHGYGADFSVRHRTASPCAGPVLNVERKHHYKAPLTQPHQRDLRAKSNTPTYEVSKSHHYQGSQTHKSDLTSMVGPIYNTGKLTKHNFSGGYVAPKARADQVELVSKFFKGDKTEQSETRMDTRTETHQSQQIEQIETKSTKVEFAGGEERRKEALERRQEFLKQQEDLHMKITSSSQYNVSNAKSRQQLEEEREAYIKNAVLRVQEEALMLSNRAKEEENKRIEYIRMETERIAREDILRAEAMVRAEEERKLKEMARQEEMKRQQAAMSKQREELEKMRLLKKKQGSGLSVRDPTQNLLPMEAQALFRPKGLERFNHPKCPHQCHPLRCNHPKCQAQCHLPACNQPKCHLLTCNHPKCLH